VGDVNGKGAALQATMNATDEFPRVETRGLSTAAVNSPYGERLWNIPAGF